VRTPPRAIPEALVGSGTLIIDGLPSDRGGAGMQVTDGRPQGFFARITAQPVPGTNAYGFVRADEVQPSFPQLVGDAAYFGDGATLAAYEVRGNTSVPVDGSAVVWLEPLRLSVGYGFTFAGGNSTFTSGFNVASAQTPITGTPAVVVQVALPGAGKYMISGQLSAQALPSSQSGHENLFGRIHDLTTNTIISHQSCAMCCVQILQETFCSTFHMTNTPLITTGPDVVALMCYRDDNASWVNAYAGNINPAGFSSFESYIFYEKVG
jgi:hypothetical protein